MDTSYRGNPYHCQTGQESMNKFVQICINISLKIGYLVHPAISETCQLEKAFSNV